jgi:TRAP-type C4-dicarboxylate transport system substrate-binding protein
MLKKKVITILLIFTVCMIAITSIGQTGEAKYKIRIASHHPEKHEAIKVLKTIKETIEEKSNGDIEITIYPGGQLGDYTTIYEEVMRGTIEMAHICTTGRYDEKMEMNYLPYLFINYEQIAKVYFPGSYFFDKYVELNKNLGVKLLGIYTEGFIGVGTKSLPKEIADPKVKKNELIRVWPSNIAKLVMEDMGYSTLTIPFSELFTALQTGVADGWFGGTSELNYVGFRDAIKYYIPYNICIESTVYIINEKYFNSMPEKYQKLIEDEFSKAALASFSTCEIQDKLYIQKLADYGIKIVDLSDEQRAVIADHIRRVTWPKLVDKFGREIMEGLQNDLK